MEAFFFYMSCDGGFLYVFTLFAWWQQDVVV